MDDVLDSIDKVLRASGLHDKPALDASELHSWECIYTERFGPCTCYDDLVNAIAAVLVTRPERVDLTQREKFLATAFLTEYARPEPAWRDRSTHNVHRGAATIPCFCWATRGHAVGQEVTTRPPSDLTNAERLAAQRAHNDPEVTAAANLFVTIHFGGCHHRAAAFFQELARLRS